MDAERRPGVARRALPGSQEPTRRRPRDHPGPAIPAHAAVRRLGWARRRSCRQAAPPRHHPDLGRLPGAAARATRPRRPRPGRLGPPLGGVPPVAAARGGQHVRQPRPPDVRHRDGGQGRPLQRREPEQHRHERRPGHRPRHRGHAHRHGRARRVLPRQLGQLCGGDRGVDAHAIARTSTPPSAWHAPRASCARASATCGGPRISATRSCWSSWSGLARLQLHGHPPAVRPGHVPRRGRDLRPSHLAHGRRSRGGRPHRGQPGQAQHPPADRRGHRLQRH